MGDFVFLKCFSIAGKLRVRIITAGYNNNANCQFPRDIRQLDRVYSIPMRNISIAQSNKGTYFYRVKNKDINIVSEEPENIGEIKVYMDDEDDTCCICYDSKRELVLVPCGHFNMCKTCTNSILKTNKCPICRSGIACAITPDKLEIPR